jgi:hypothetical protein
MKKSYGYRTGCGIAETRGYKEKRDAAYLLIALLLPLGD